MNKKNFHVNVRYKYDRKKDKEYDEVRKDFFWKGKLLFGIWIIGSVLIEVFVSSNSRNINSYEIKEGIYMVVGIIIILGIIVIILLGVYDTLSLKVFYCVEFGTKVIYIDKRDSGSLGIEKFEELDNIIEDEYEKFSEIEIKEIKKFVYEQMQISMKYRKKIDRNNNILIGIITVVIIPILSENPEIIKNSLKIALIALPIGGILFCLSVFSINQNKNLNKISEFIDIKILENS